MIDENQIQDERLLLGTPSTQVPATNVPSVMTRVDCIAGTPDLDFIELKHRKKDANQFLLRFIIRNVGFGWQQQVIDMI